MIKLEGRLAGRGARRDSPHVASDASVESSEAVHAEVDAENLPAHAQVKHLTH